MNEERSSIPRGLRGTCVTACLVAGLWVFPVVWYTEQNEETGQYWLEERTALEGWQYEEVPVAKSAERVLVADQVVSGTFKRQNAPPIRVFSAKRYQENQNEIGLFVHTPDRCWTEAGWKLEATTPDMIELEVHGVKMRFERRIFRGGDHRELVYFCGLVGGQPLPYRLDHNLSVGMRYRMKEEEEASGAVLRASDERFWKRVWQSFTSRSRLLGPKQFVRISTSLDGQTTGEADRLLKEFLPQWLELDAWEEGE